MFLSCKVATTFFSFSLRHVRVFLPVPQPWRHPRAKHLSETQKEEKSEKKKKAYIIFTLDLSMRLIMLS